MNRCTAFRTRAGVPGILLLLALLASGCGGGPAPTPLPTMPSPTLVHPADSTFSLTSTAFAAGQSIPRTFTCKAENRSPALAWTDPPAGTVSLALVMDDPDAPDGDFVHWVLYNLPASARALPEGVPAAETGPDGSRQGITGFDKVGYGGPCPPSGTHHYFFRLSALDTTLDLPAGATKAQLVQAMQGHILGQAELMGTFSR